MTKVLIIYDVKVNKNQTRDMVGRKISGLFNYHMK